MEVYVGHSHRMGKTPLHTMNVSHASYLQCLLNFKHFCKAPVHQNLEALHLNLILGITITETWLLGIAIGCKSEILFEIIFTMFLCLPAFIANFWFD